jgi:hypothetical protein
LVVGGVVHGTARAPDSTGSTTATSRTVTAHSRGAVPPGVEDEIEGVTTIRAWESGGRQQTCYVRCTKGSNVSNGTSDAMPPESAAGCRPPQGSLFRPCPGTIVLRPCPGAAPCTWGCMVPFFLREAACRMKGPVRDGPVLVLAGSECYSVAATGPMPQRAGHALPARANSPQQCKGPCQQGSRCAGWRCSRSRIGGAAEWRVPS